MTDYTELEKLHERYLAMVEEVGEENVPATWYSTFKLLMDRQGEWVPVRSYLDQRSASSAAAAIRAGRIKVPKGIWDLQPRRRENGSELFARYVRPTQVDQVQFIPAKRGRDWAGVAHMDGRPV